MSAKGWTMSAVAVAVAAGTYFILDTVYPPQQDGVEGPRLAAVDAVFSRSLQPPAASVSDAPAQPAREQPVTADPVDEAPVDEPQQASADDVFDAEPPPEEPPPATPPPRPTPWPTATPPPRAAAAPAAAKPAATPTAAQAQRVTQWWGPESADRLSVVYAGSAAYTRAIVLMFNGTFAEAAAVQQHLRVADANGRTVTGSWEIGASNRRMLLFPVSRAGNYTVHVGAELADSNGRRLGSELKGPVRVQ